MATLQVIQNLLNIEIGDKKLCPGRKREDKNRYYRFDDHYIVQLTKGMWMIVSNSNTVRRLLRLHCWCFNQVGYAMTSVDGTIKAFHQLFLQYEAGLVCDHIDKCRFNNRFENLRIVTPRQNSRNQTKRSDNTSGMTGVSEVTTKGNSYIRADICNNDRKQIFKLFSINKLGREEALRRAIAQRREWVQQFGYDHE